MAYVYRLAIAAASATLLGISASGSSGLETTDGFQIQPDLAFTPKAGAYAYHNVSGREQLPTSAVTESWSSASASVQALTEAREAATAAYLAASAAAHSEISVRLDASELGVSSGGDRRDESTSATGEFTTATLRNDFFAGQAMTLRLPSVPAYLTAPAASASAVPAASSSDREWSYGTLAGVPFRNDLQTTVRRTSTDSLTTGFSAAYDSSEIFAPASAGGFRDFSGDFTVVPNLPTVPEPGTWAVGALLVGTGFFAHLRRRRAVASR